MQAPNMTAKQCKWLVEYLACGNATASAVRAGYSAKGASVAGHRMLRNARVQEALQARQAADATRLSIQREDVLNGLMEVVATGRAQSNPMAMLRGWVEIAKLLGLAAPERIKVDVNLAGSLEMGRLNQLSDAELLKIIEAEQAAQPEQRDFAPVAG